MLLKSSEFTCKVQIKAFQYIFIDYGSSSIDKDTDD